MAGIACQMPDLSIQQNGKIHMLASTDNLIWCQWQLPEDKLLRGVYAVLLPFCGEEVSQLAHVLFGKFAAKGLPP